MNAIIGIGYEGIDPESFLSRLRLRGVDTVVDVRLTPLSRKRGFSKNALRELLESAQIGYVHLPALGNPKENRAAYGSNADANGRSARDRFTQILRNEPGESALRELLGYAHEGTVAVLCFEESEDHCHRQQVIAEAHLLSVAAI